MSKLKTTTYELRDVAIIQAPVSFTNHREDVDNQVIICKRKCYPIFVAPMASVTDENNYKVWQFNGLTPVIPRSVNLSFEERIKLAEETFVSVSLREAQEELLLELNNKFAFGESGHVYICIDIAHGTLSELYDICKKLKSCFGSKVEIMTGNIASPDAYQFYADAGIDWVRAGIGGGSRCTTSANLGVHYGMATLLDQLNEARKAYMHSHNGVAPTKIIADGGIDNFDAINKAIALGADAVMCGNLIARSEEACGEIFERDGNRYREYYGMSTKRAQLETGGSGKKTSEGISKPVPVEYPIAKWVDNMQSYLRSIMTYTNSRNIEEFRTNSQVVILGGGDSAYRK